MGLEQFAVGFLVCLVIIVIATLIAILMNWLSDDCGGVGYFIMMWFACIGFGICLTYILYQNGVL